MLTWAQLCASLVPAPATVSVEAYQGASGYGPVYAAPVDVTPCWVDDTRRLVRVQTQDAAGAEQVSSTTVYGPLDATCPPGSRVTLPSGRTARVLAVSRLEGHGLLVPEHQEIALE